MPVVKSKGYVRSEIIQGNPNPPPENSFYELPLPIPPHLGGLGKSIGANDEGIPHFHGGEVHLIPTPDDNRIYTSKGWSKHEFLLRADVDFDQNLSRASKVRFLEVESGDDNASVILAAKAGHHRIVAATDCLLDQRLDLESEPSFAGLCVRGTASLEGGARLGKTAENAEEGTIAYEKGQLLIHNGKRWISAQGNVVGAGSGGYLAAWNKEGQLLCAPGLRVDGNYLLFGEKAEAIFAAVTLKRVHDETGAALDLGGPLLLGMGGKPLAGALRARPDYRPEWSDGESWFRVGTGDGNVCGEGRQNLLAVWTEKGLADAPARVSPKGVYLGPDHAEKSAKFPLHVGGAKQVAQFDGAIGIGDKVISEKNGRLFVEENEIMLLPKFGSIVLGEGFAKGKETQKTKVIGEDIELSIERAEEDRYGICLFDNNMFSVKDGKVGFKIDAIGEATRQKAGLMSPEVLSLLLDKQDTLKFGNLEGDEVISIEGSGVIVGDSLRIKTRKASNKEHGVAAFSKEFHVEDGNVILNYAEMKYASTEGSGLLSRQNFKHFWEKQDKLTFGKFEESEGCHWEGSGKPTHGNACLKLKYATKSERGIAGYNARDFIVENGFVSLKEQNNELLKHALDVLSKKQDRIASPVQGAGEHGYLAIWSDGLLSHTHLICIEDDAVCFDSFARFEHGLSVGSCELEPAKAGPGTLRWERGQIEVSNGDSWQPLGGGSLGGSGKPGTLPFFTNECAITGSEKLLWNEEESRLGIGTEKPAANIHLALPKASLLVSDTRSSGPQSGGVAAVESEDGQWLSKGDRLGDFAFFGHGVPGGYVRAVAEENWSKNACGTRLIFGSVKTGTGSIIDHMVLSGEGFLGIGNMLPTAPLHVSGSGKSGNSAKFEASIQVGKNDNSASLAGQGAIRFTSGSLQFSNGTDWISILSESSILKLIKENAWNPGAY